MSEWIKNLIGWYLDKNATSYNISWRMSGWKYIKPAKQRSGFSHDCPFCGHHIVVCNSPKYLKCIYCCKRWKLEKDENNEQARER